MLGPPTQGRLLAPGQALPASRASCEYAMLLATQGLTMRAWRPREELSSGRQTHQASIYQHCFLQATFTCSDNKSIMLSILDLSKFTNGFSRPIIEGEAYYASGMLFGVGLLEKKGTVYKCQGLAVQTSAATGKPHEIDICFDISKQPGNRIVSLQCSCIAGKSEKCKHAVATMLWLNRHEEDELADISCTDVQQQWGILKTSGRPVFEGTPISELCHVKQKKGPEIPAVSEEMKKKWEEKLLKSCPLSELSLFFSGLRQCYGIPANEEDASSQKAEYESRIQKLLDRPLPPVLDRIVSLAEEELSACEADVSDFYRSQVMLSKERCVRICLDTHEQSQSDLWFLVRKLRISGSVCYALHTYSVNKKPDWSSKYKSIYGSKFQGNEDTVYGLQSETFARELYAENIRSSILETGVVIRSEVPFLCFSPDGIILDDNGNVVGLFETKAPKEGKRLTAEELVCNNLVKNVDSNLQLKAKCPWYGQVQLGMLLLGLPSAELVIYSSFKDAKAHMKPSIYPIYVPFNSDFCLEMCTRLCKTYFRELLPRMMSDSNTVSLDDCA